MLCTYRGINNFRNLICNARIAPHSRSCVMTLRRDSNYARDEFMNCKSELAAQCGLEQLRTAMYTNWFVSHVVWRQLISHVTRFSDRLDVSGCMNHKWLVEDASPKELSPEILAVQTTNISIVTILPTEQLESTECAKSNDDVPEIREEDKENALNNSDGVDKSPSTNYTPPVTTKLVLEKSLSISLFPDAPTTPKVCRKMLYDDEEDLNASVKELVKKYQANECQQSPKFATPCCTEETSGDCILCHPKATPTKPPSLEIDKGIICWASSIGTQMNLVQSRSPLYFSLNQFSSFVILQIEN